MNKRLQEILNQVAQYEKETPYNYCDRWCERCVFEKQVRCKVYQDELEQRMTCLAYGKDERDPEITGAVMKRQLEEIGEEIDERFEEEHEIDLDTIDDPEFERIKQHIEFVENHSLRISAHEYCRQVQTFLQEAFYPQKREMNTQLIYDFETIAWYHTLLPIKIQRGLAGFHEPACEGDLALYDAVGQFEVCKKAIRESIRAFHKIGPRLPSYQTEVTKLLALLNNLHSRIQALEESL